MRRLLTLAGVLLAALSAAQLRVATWNISNYTGGRQADLSASIFDTYQSRSMRPDIIVTQEFTSQAAQDSFLQMLNAGAFGAVWQAAPFTNGPDTESAFFYRSDRVVLVGSQIILEGGNSPLPPRDVKRYDVVLLGYSAIAPKLAIYSTHMKAGTASGDLSRRLAEAMALRANIASLSGFNGAILAGDFNMQSSTEDAYVKLTGSEANNAGRLFDPINTVGDWDNDGSFRYVHTQDPSASGMDSRYDFILLNAPLLNGAGFDYIGQPSVPYSTVTWNDPAHSYRVWGNDGSSFNSTLTIAGNAMVGPSIAQALINACTTNGGHLPVYLDLRVPAEIGTNTTTLDFGTVVQGSSAQQSVNVFNRAEVTRWSNGIATLFYQLAASSGFSAPGGSFFDQAGGGTNSHAISIDTSTTGVKSGMLTVSTSDDPPHQKSINLTGQVVPDQLYPSTWALEAGKIQNGTFANLLANDNLRLSLINDTRVRVPDPIKARFEFTSPVPSIGSMTIKIESLSLNSLRQFVDLYDFSTNAYAPFGFQQLTPTDGLHTVSPSNPSRFIEPGTRTIRLRLRWRGLTGAGPIAPVSCAIDTLCVELR